MVNLNQRLFEDPLVASERKIVGSRKIRQKIAHRIEELEYERDYEELPFCDTDAEEQSVEGRYNLKISRLRSQLKRLY